ncbi:MAG: glycosyltransferase [Desulfobulbaceae bacterium]|jgi:rhamnosyltransferase|nr:glycosyltransferase [Desulfobulbaceae bacterium]
MEETVSVLIPTRNAAASLERLLASLGRQTLRPLEVVVCDSASQDATPEIARRHGASVITINADNFDHAGTRSRMARAAHGDIVVFLTHDAIPADDRALELLVAALRQDDDIGCAYGRQIAAPSASASARFLRDFNYPPSSEIRSFSDRGRLGFATFFCSNSFAAWRKKALEQIGWFGNSSIFGEDALAAARLLKAGFRLAYAAEARVEHSHNYGLAEEFRRSFDIGVFHAGETWLLAAFGGPTDRGKHFVIKQAVELFRAGKIGTLVATLCHNGAKACGYLLGRRCHLIPRRLCRLFSMNRRWWR